jgi:cyanophycinase
MYPLLLTAACLIGQGSPATPEGHLVIVGGGPTPLEILERALALAGGKQARVLVVPFASNRRDAGQRGERLWRLAGAEHVAALDPTDRKAALRAVQQANLIWLSGGSQSRLMRMLTQEELVKAIRERFQHGATIGGTSAGAAVMSVMMLTGEDKSDVLSIGPTHLRAGLGLWPDVIIDQHYLIRGRSNRLLSAVLNHPECVGIGIDERTAVVVTGHGFEVIGKSNVMVLDARKATAVNVHVGEAVTATNVTLYVLRTGDRFSLEPTAVPEKSLGGKVADRRPVAGHETAVRPRTEAGTGHTR